jgi:hypothetical protein
LHQLIANDDNKKSNLPSLHEEGENDGADDKSDIPDDDNEVNTENKGHEVDDVNGIDTLLEMNDLQENQRHEGDMDLPQTLDFDDMWENASCDTTTAQEFERIKRKKHHEKEKRRQRRKQVKDDKLNTARRLRLFERRKEKDQSIVQQSDCVKKATEKQSKLSDAFVDAIQKVFDDGSVNSAASSADQSKAEVDRFDNQSANGSCASLYLQGDDESEKVDDDSNDDVSMNSGNEKSKQESHIRNRSTNDDATVDDMATIQELQAKHGKKGSKKRGQLEKGNKSKNTKSKKAKKRITRVEIDSSEIFLAEVERLKRPKVLTIAALKQEMIDRRGTSVNLVKKEYVNYRKKHNDRRKGLIDNELKPIDFGALSEQLKNKKQDDDIFHKATTDSNNKDDPESVSKQQHTRGGLGAKLSRWKETEGITDLDDLATVMDVPAPTVSLLSAATAFAKTTVAHIPDVAPTINDIQDIARDAGRGLNTATNTVYATGQAVGGTMAQVGGRATRTVGMGISHSAQTVNIGIQSSAQVFSKGGNMVSDSLSSLMPTTTSSDIKQPELTMDDIKGNTASKGDDNIGMFNASFSAMPLSMIEEADDDDDDDDDHGLLHSHHKGRNDFHHHSFDGRSFQNDDDDNDNDDDSIGLRSMNSNPRSFKMGKLKGPKLGISLKKFVPKLPKRNQSETTNRGGFLLGGGNNNNGYGGMAL